MINVKEEIQRLFVRDFLNNFVGNWDALKEKDIQQIMDNIERLVYCAKPTVTIRRTVQITCQGVNIEIKKGTKVKLNEIKKYSIPYKAVVSLTYMAQGNITTFDTDIRNVVFTQ